MLCSRRYLLAQAFAFMDAGMTKEQAWCMVLAFDGPPELVLLEDPDVLREIAEERLDRLVEQMDSL